ncbi:glycine-rich domain-containing protein [Streptomyces sp. 8K308]|uniref:glycine-rich domain-containing protein n=1 Tax=Streptomyces sp. 8K308 TaxID=2530388 RepID=UPI001FB8315E|nr:hypothetical protein [Streptomyces sp. 8K308]
MAQVCVCPEYFTITDTGELCLRAGQQGLRERRIYLDVGVHQFRRSDYPWLARVRVQVQGAGGGSAGADASAGQCTARPGGAGGGYSESLIEASALGAVETVVVGEGGAAGIRNNPGGAGGSSSFGGFCTAPGGRRHSEHGHRHDPVRGERRQRGDQRRRAAHHRW